MRLTDPVSEIKGVGEKTATLLSKLNIVKAADLIYDLPRGFMDIKEPVIPCKELVGSLVSVRGSIVRGSVHIIKKGRTMTFAKVECTDENGIKSGNSVSIVYFNAPYMKKTLEKMDDERIFFGILSDSRGFMIAQPSCFTPQEYREMLRVLQPVYSLTKGISNNQIKKLIKNAFEAVSLPDEYLDRSELDKYGIPDIKEAHYTLHFPTDMEEHKRARKRVAFHEFLSFFIQTHPDEDKVERTFDKNMIEVADTE